MPEPIGLTRGRCLDRSPPLFLDRTYLLWVGPTRGAVVALAVALSSLSACGPRAEDVERSMSEFRLAATLHEENPLNNRPVAMEHLLRSLQLDPRNARALLLLGYLQLLEGNTTKATTSFTRAVDIISDGDALENASLLAEAHNMLGLAYIHDGRYDDAIAILRRAAGEDTNRAAYMAWGNLGWAYQKKGTNDEALSAFRQSVALQPRYCEGYFRMGEVQFSTGDFAAAEQSFTRALEADDRCQRFYQDAWWRRGETRARLGHREDAVLDLERCVALGQESEAGQACRRMLSVSQ